MFKDIASNPKHFFKQTKGDFTTPTIVELNAMTFISKSPRQIFDTILKEVDPGLKKVPLRIKGKIALLKEVITDQSSKSPIFLFIDELDNLFGKGDSDSEEIMFEIFNLTEYPNSRMVTIGISNSIDLIVKLSQKKKIPLPKMKHLVFEQYSWRDLFDIVR